MFVSRNAIFLEEDVILSNRARININLREVLELLSTSSSKPITIEPVDPVETTTVPSTGILRCSSR